MATFRLCKNCKDFHDIMDWPIGCMDIEPSRSKLPMPNLATDVMDAVQSQATGKMHDSKSSLRKEYKSLGMIEVGNDPARNRPKPKPKPDSKGIKKTIEKATARFERGERTGNK